MGGTYMQIQGYTLNMKNRTKDKTANIWNTQQTRSDKTEHKKTIFVGNGQTNQSDTLAQKKKEAQDKAMKVIRDAFAKEIEIDNGIEESREKISDSKAKIAEAQEQIKALEEQKEEIRKNGCSEDEYKEVCADYAKQEAEFYSQIQDAKSTVMDENASIRQVKIDRIQNQDMQNAMQEADDIMDAAGKDMIQTAMKEMQERMEEKRKEEAEKAKEKAEEEEKEKKLKERVEERNAESQPVTETRAVTESILTHDQLKDSTTSEIKNILDDYTLTEEDIKGMSIDSKL